MMRMSKNIKINIKAGILTISGILFLSVYLNAQQDKKFIRKGNREYGKENYSESEIQYRKAEEKSKRSPDAVFNIGDALYRQKKYDDASKQFLDNANMNEDVFKKASAWYNMGNSLLQSRKVKESIEAYKNSLKLDPDNQQAKYNLGYAQNLLKQQEQQQNKDKDKDQNKDDQKKKDDENKKDQDKKQDQND